RPCDLLRLHVAHRAALARRRTGGRRTTPDGGGKLRGGLRGLSRARRLGACPVRLVSRRSRLSAARPQGGRRMVPALASLILLFGAPDEPKIALVTNDEKSPAVQSLQALWKDRLRLNPESAKGSVALVLSGDARPWIDSGATVLLDL